jgi:K+-transporting ATPase ATPase A chain
MFLDILQMIIIIALLIVGAVLIGGYIYKIITKEKCFVDPVMNRVDGFIYKICGVKTDADMTTKQYILNLVVLNVLFLIVLFIVLCFQGILPLNPNGIKNMSPGLSSNTAISFITNTNLQDYSGESGVSILSQLLLTVFMFIAPATGLAATAAFLRNLAGGKQGNFFVDLTRFVTRLLLPFSFIASLLYMWQGVPQTFAKNQIITTIEGTKQIIPLGPIASLESIKNLASNGGGFFGANSAHPFENPTVFSNILTIICLGLISTAIVFAFGKMLKNRKQAIVLFSVAFLLLISSVALTYFAENAGNPSINSLGMSNVGNMEGKETRFGIAGSSLFSAATTAYQVGAVNDSQDSLTPLGGLAAMWNMFIQAAFGGKGTGTMYLIMYAILAVFLCGLMVGRTPEYLGKKVEGKEVKYIAVALLAHPLLILVPVAIALVLPAGLAGISNPGYHGLSQILYQYTSSAANNGSGFEGLGDNTAFYNISAGIVMFLGRYVPISALLLASGSFAAKRSVPVAAGTLRTDKPIFAFMLLFIIFVIGALTFFPAMALGPIAEHLTLR